MASPVPPSVPAPAPDLGAVELFTGVKVTWDNLTAAARAAAAAGGPAYVDPDPRLTELTTLPIPPGDPRLRGFAPVNEAELRLAAQMDRATAVTSFALYRARAAGIGAEGIEAIASDFTSGKADATEEGTKVMRAALAQLLQATHTRFGDRRRNRLARDEASRRLFAVALAGVIGPILLVALIFLLSRLFGWLDWCDACKAQTFFTLTGKYHLMALLYCGCVGAIFSRLIAFQSLEGEITFTDLKRNYSWLVILLRLFVGGIAAFVVYYLIVGNILGGDIFPPLSGGDLGPLWKTVGVGAETKVAYTMPTEGFAKMMIWCFIAGFSERFIPDKLAQVEAKATVRGNG